MTCIDMYLISKHRSTGRAAKQSEELLSTLARMASVILAIYEAKYMPAIIQYHMAQGYSLELRSGKAQAVFLI